MEFNYTRLKAELDREYKIDEYQAKLDALDWVRSKLREDEPITPVITEQKTQSTAKKHDNGVETLGIRKLILRILPNLPTEFTKEHIIARLREVVPERAATIKTDSFRSQLFQMARDEELTVVKTGGGNNLTIYRRGPRSFDAVS